MITFIVPAFNEEKDIAPTVATIRTAAEESGLDDFEIILIDDGSTDCTAAQMAALAADDSRIRVISHSVNLGLGASIRAGIEAASAPAFMVVPGDNDISKGMMVMMLNFRDEADVILTTPLNKEQRNLTRNIISMFYQMAYMTMFDIYVSYINGPGIWPTAAARAAGLKSRRFSIISELNVKVLRMGCSFAEVPGYFQAGPKVRRTVTWRNLTEVITSFGRLIFHIHIRGRKRFAARPTRKQIDFVNRLLRPAPKLITTLSDRRPMRTPAFISSQPPATNV
jgi:glycosyltransferase involved in cell wall biosynthesis